MHPLFKNIIKKNSGLAVVGVVSVVSGIVCLIAAVVKTMREIHTTAQNALDAYAESQK